jgi:hypothetical protein
VLCRSEERELWDGKGQIIVFQMAVSFLEAYAEGVSRICLTSGQPLRLCCVRTFPVQSVHVYGFCKNKFCIQEFNNMVFVYLFQYCRFTCLCKFYISYSLKRHIRLVKTDKKAIAEHSIEQDHIIELLATKLFLLKLEMYTQCYSGYSSYLHGLHRQSVSKRRNINIRGRGITQKKEYNN